MRSGSNGGQVTPRARKCGKKLGNGMSGGSRDTFEVIDGEFPTRFAVGGCREWPKPAEDLRGVLVQSQ